MKISSTLEIASINRLKVKIVDIVADVVQIGMQFLDDGTVGIGVSGSATAIGGITGNVSLVADKHGNAGVVRTVVGVGGSPSAGLGITSTNTNAPNI